MSKDLLVRGVGLGSLASPIPDSEFVSHDAAVPELDPVRPRGAGPDDRWDVAGLAGLDWAVHLAALLAFVGPVAFVLFITRYQIQPEERVLKDIFGDSYLAYAARTRRWL